MLAEALFERIEAKGLREITLRLTEEAIAHGFGTTMAARSEVIAGYGRGERDSPCKTQRPGPFLLVNRTPVREGAQETA